MTTEEAKYQYSKLCHDAGQLGEIIRSMQSDLEDLYIKIKNAKLDYKRAKDTETPAEATQHHPV